MRKLLGAFTFRIEGYSGLSTAVGGSSESPEFDLCGHVWQLRIFPGGSLEAHKGHLSFYLASKSPRQARASYKLSVLCQHSPSSANGAAGDTRSSWLTGPSSANPSTVNPAPAPRTVDQSPLVVEGRDETFSSSGIRVFEAKGLQVSGMSDVACGVLYVVSACCVLCVML